MQDFIEIYDNSLTSYQCKEMIDMMNDEDLTPGTCGSGDDGRPEVRKDVKDSQDVSGRFSAHITHPITINLVNSLQKGVDLYVKKHPQLSNLADWDAVDDYNFQKYNPAQGYFGNHCENESPAHMARVAVWMIYLNTVTEGGGTRFDNYDRVVDAVEGRLVIWPAYWTHHHHGIVSKTQTKYIVTGWFAYNTEDYTKKEKEMVERSVEKSMKEAISGLFSGL